jgi:hypothetical protein
MLARGRIRPRAARPKRSLRGRTPKAERGSALEKKKGEEAPWAIPNLRIPDSEEEKT